MTEEERFQKIKNIYLNYEHELAQRGMEDVAPIAASLTTSYVLHALVEEAQGGNDETETFTMKEVLESVNLNDLYEEEWDSQP